MQEVELVGCARATISTEQLAYSLALNEPHPIDNFAFAPPSDNDGKVGQLSLIYSIAALVPSHPRVLIQPNRCQLNSQARR